MPDSVVPDPEFQPAADLDVKRVERMTAETVGRAEREATAITAEMDLISTRGVHSGLTIAFLRGYMAGYGVVIDRLDGIVGERKQEPQS